MFRKIVSITAFVFLLCGSVYSQDWMPDKNLRRVVRETLKLEIDEPLTQKTMSNLVELYAQGRQIRDITGLEFAINLKVFYIYGTSIVDLTPLTNLELRVLNAGGCKIVDVSPLENMITLEYLYLHGNRITNIMPLLNLKNLKELWLLGNPISDFTSIDQALELEFKDWGQTCIVPNTLTFDKILNKPYPAIFGGWSEILNLPNQTELDLLANFDLAFCL